MAKKSTKPDKKAVASKGKGGRPSSYRPEYAEQARKLCLLGATNPEMAQFFGVATSTVSKWLDEIPEFSDALKSGRAGADMEVASSLYRKAILGETVACIFWLKNRRRDLWRDRPDPVSDDDNTAQPVKVVVNVVDGRKPDAKPE